MLHTKICTKCKKEKDLDSYHRKKAAKDGFNPRCKECKREDDKLYREINHKELAANKLEYYYENREEILENRRVHYSENKEQIKELRKEADKKYREENRELIRENHRKWRENNPERLKLVRDKCNATEGHRLRVKKYKRSEKGRQVGYKSSMKRRSSKYKVDFVSHERREILDRDDWMCQVCGCIVHDENVNNETKSHIDHIIPISKGGNSEPNNLQILCRTCNLKKSDSII